MTGTQFSPAQREARRGPAGAEGRMTQGSGGWGAGNAAPLGPGGGQINSGPCEAGQGRAAAPGATHPASHTTPPHPARTQSRAELPPPPGPTLTTHVHTYSHTRCPRTARPHRPQQPWALCVQPGSSLACLPEQSSQGSPLAARKPGEILPVSPTCSPRTPAWPAPGQLRGLWSRPGGMWGCGKGPPTPSTASTLECAERSGRPNPRSAPRGG